MNEKYIIPISGVIGQDFRYTDILMHLHNAKQFVKIHLLINSIGGLVEDGLKIFDAIKNSGKFITSENSGNVCSIATLLFLTAPNVKDRLFDPKKGIFLIHNPYLENFSGDADAFKDAEKHLRPIENGLAKKYEEITGADKDLIHAFMKENIELTPEQIEKLGFATLVNQENKPQALALFNFNKSIHMNTKEVEEKLSIFEKALNKIIELVTPSKPKNMILQDVNGVELELSVNTPEEITVGISAMISGQPAEGSFVLPDGRTLVFVGGQLTEIVEGVDDKQKELEAAKTEIEALKTENASLKTENQMLTKSFTDVQKAFKDFKNQFSQHSPEDKTTPEPDEKKKQKEPVVFKFKARK